MRPLKIAVLHGTQDSSFRVRFHGPLSWLQSQGAIVVLPPIRAWEADVVLLHRQYQPGALGVVRSLHRHGIRVVADIDENIFAAPLEHPSAELYRSVSFQARVAELIRTVGPVWVPNENLATTLSRFNTKVSVIPNGIDLGQWPNATRSKARESVGVVGFAGTASHIANLEIVRAALVKLSSRLAGFTKYSVRACFGSRNWRRSGVGRFAVHRR